MGYKIRHFGKINLMGPGQFHGFEQRVTIGIYPTDFGLILD
jgi:hypothetical protein